MALDRSRRSIRSSRESAWPNRAQSTFGDQRIWLIGRRDLVSNKQAAGRPQDLLDLALLARHEPTP